LAQEKLKEINEAYDYLMKNKSSRQQTRWEEPRYSRSTESNYGGYGYTGAQSDEFEEVIRYMNAGNLSAAEEALNRIPNRNAYWHYLRGMIFMRRGWYSEAQSSLQTAVNMDPNNFEYRSALNRLMNFNRTYTQNMNRRSAGMDPDICSICECLICSDCCCECLGGDLISCC